ncbi:MAG TPA: hypothetical protein VFH43_14720 [Candidatus Kapabacteria bacterium]|nr:hypothetical protein [Candidatus Kapabacteria bacterium]
MRALWTKFRTEALLIIGGLLVLLTNVLAQHAILNTQDSGWFVAAPQPTSIVSALGVPLDDVFIHCRYAQNLLAGDGFVFNPGEQVSADTSPLWVFLIVIGGLFTSRLELVAIFLSMLCYLVIAPGVYRIARDLLEIEEVWAALAGALAIISSRLIWSSMSGMETILAALLALLIAEEHARQALHGRIRIREGVLYGLGFLTRPELALLAALCAAHWIYISRKKEIDVSNASYAALTAIAIALPFLAFNLVTRGKLVPHSTFVQGHLAADPGYLLFAIKILATHNVFLIVGIVMAMALFRKPEWQPALIFMLVLPVLQAFFAPQYRHHGRYLFPILPLVILFGVSGMRLRFGRLGMPWKIAICVVTILISAGDALRWISLSAYSVRNINDQQIAAAGWLYDFATDSTVVAVHDVGALAYLTDRKLLDLTGLVTPRMFKLQRDQSSVWRSAREMGANTFVIYNRLNPALYDTFKDSLELLAEFRVRKPLVSSADTVMSAYRIKH